jgi:EAL and modified HD-GYP domain-containing signal transduction protein
VNRPSVTLNELDDIIRRDASLAQRVLRYANSAAVGRRQTTGSIRQALLVIGLDQVRRWVSVWSLAGLGASRVPEVMTMAVVRARCCERLGAAVLGEDQSGECFVLGLCSLLDVLLGGPMEDVLKVLSLPDESMRALTGGRNTHRDVLDAVVAYERGQWPTVQDLCATLRIRSADLAEFYTDATRWAGELTETRG